MSKNLELVQENGETVKDSEIDEEALRYFFTKLYALP